jgi:hypothetical protein
VIFSASPLSSVFTLIILAGFIPANVIPQFLPIRYSVLLKSISCSTWLAVANLILKKYNFYKILIAKTICKTHIAKLRMVSNC